MPVPGYNHPGVINTAVEREHVKALIDRLNDEQVQALWVILNSMAWSTEKISPEEAAEIEESFAEIDAGKGVKAEDVWRELGV
jgi:restriction endonuclease